HVNLEPHKKTILVIISGDGDFVAPLRLLRSRTERKEARLEVWVVSWKKQLARVLEEISDKVIYLDTLLKFIDPIGYELSKKKKRNK
ncbi:MAG: hypothetical protein COV85_03010, partial [Candidatus Portnoybacteria bacterium CG11_big_fil_rev_8_21_14_0_20_44_10]